MDARGAASTLVELGCRREGLLNRLAAAPAAKADLMAATDASASTVDRGVAELRDAGLVESVDGEYRLTRYGRTVHEQVRELGGGLIQLVEWADVLGTLPPDAPVDPAVVRAGTLRRGTAAREALSTRLRGADRVGLDVPAAPPWAEPYLEWTAPGARLEVVVPESATRRLAATLGERPGGADTALRETPRPLPTALVISVGGDAPGVAVCGHDEGAVAWALENDDATALGWARRTFDRRWRAATPLPSP